MLYPLVPETEEYVPEGRHVSQPVAVPDAEEWEDETYVDDYDVAEFQHHDVFYE